MLLFSFKALFRRKCNVVTQVLPKEVICNGNDVTNNALLVNPAFYIYLIFNF